MIKAAGVLPYSKDSNGNTWFLLGREKPNPNWGIDSGSWSEFGGSISNKETPESGAAREFFEETMGCVFGHKDWMENELYCGRYLLAMDSKTPSGKGYRSFLKYVPFVDYPAKFAQFKTLSKKQPDLLRQISTECFGKDGNVLPTCTEKTSMGWFSVEQMKLAVEKYKRVRKNHPNPSYSSSSTLTNCNFAAKKSFYEEPNMIPHIRKGFAMDFDHLLSTTWAQNDFQNDEDHFPLVLSSPESPADFDIIKTSSGTLRPVIKTPRFVKWRKSCQSSSEDKSRSSSRPVTPQTEDKGKPPVILVRTEGYSFKKKKKRKRKRTRKNEQLQSAGRSRAIETGRKEWITVDKKHSLNRRQKKSLSPHNEIYKPKPPIF